jgi:hypothetical protein
MTSEEAFRQEKLRPNDFVEEVMLNSSQPGPPMTVFEGLLGKSTRNGHWRLYFSSEFDLYLEFPESDVRIRTIPKEISGLGFDLQKVWMSPDTPIEVICRSRELQAGMTAELLDVLLSPQEARGHRHR